MTTKRTTQDGGEETAAAVEEVSSAPVLDLRKMYEDQIKQMEQLMALAKASGVDLGITPPTAAGSEGGLVREVGADEWIPTGAGGVDERGVERTWGKDDLDPRDKHNFVPQLIPGLVHPVLDSSRRPVIFCRINGLEACLTVGVLNTNISGMFYHFYKNAEDMMFASEKFMNEGPASAPWVGQGPQRTNTWYREAVAPQAWIDLDGRYYTAGAPMPIATGSE